MVNRPGAVFGGLALCILCGCSPISIPTKSHPICSWAMSPPSNANQLCTVAFKTLSTIASAEQHGNDRSINVLVSNHSIARQLVTYGRHIRALGARNVHVVPSLTLDITATGLLGAASFVGGSIRGGAIREPFTLYMRVHGDQASIVAHDPGLAW